MSKPPGICCPRCNGDTDVTETRQAPGAIRRRRMCSSAVCNGKLTTYEEVVSVGEARRRRAADEVRVPRELLEQLAKLIASEQHDEDEHDYLW